MLEKKKKTEADDEIILSAPNLICFSHVNRMKTSRTEQADLQMQLFKGMDTVNYHVSKLSCHNNSDSV